MIKHIKYYVRYIFILFSILCGIILLIRCNHVASVNESQDVTQGKPMDDITITDRIGSSTGHHVLDLSGVQTQIDLAPDHIKALCKSFDQASIKETIDQNNHILLTLENVRGTADANILNVFVNEQKVGHFSLYGLENASKEEQGGKGLSFTIDITKVIKELHLSDTLDLQTLYVHISPRKTLSKSQEITIKKINIYRVRKKS